MAEQIQQPDTGQGNGLRRNKQLSTKVDLTPMVDLGFLLITFFILTKTLSEPACTHLHLPAGEEATMPAGESTALTLIPLGNEKVLYYHGEWNAAIKNHAYGVISGDGVRHIIIQKQLALDANPKFDRKDLILIIKPTEKTMYKNIIGLLDEVLINQLEHYSFVDISSAEKIGSCPNNQQAKDASDRKTLINNKSKFKFKI
jgi:biopolymer transport protein ExbD